MTIFSERATAPAVSVTSNASERQQGRELYTRYLPLVRRIALRTLRSLPPTLSLEELLSAGWVGMSEALRRRTPDLRDDEFEAYAACRVRGAILDYLRSLDPLSRQLRGASRRITAVVAKLTRDRGRPPEEQETAAALGISLGDYQQLLGRIANAGFAQLNLCSLPAPGFPEASPEALTAKKEMIDAIAAAIATLPERLQLVLELHYQQDCSLREIGEVLGVTESRVCQLHTQAVHVIRARISGLLGTKWTRPRTSTARPAGELN